MEGLSSVHYALDSGPSSAKRNKRNYKTDVNRAQPLDLGPS